MMKKPSERMAFLHSMWYNETKYFRKGKNQSEFVNKKL